MEIIYFAQRYNMSELYLDIAFLTVHKIKEKNAFGKAYYKIDSLNDRYFIGNPSDILMDFGKGLKINNWQNQPLIDKPFNCILSSKDKFLYKRDIIDLLFKY